MGTIFGLSDMASYSASEGSLFSTNSSSLFSVSSSLTSASSTTTNDTFASLFQNAAENAERAADSAASSTSSTSGSSSSSSTSDTSGLTAFLEYARETPEQRMFDSWLGNQGITKSQYNAMSAEEKQKLTTQFEQIEKAKFKEEMGTNTAASTASLSQSVTGAGIA